MADLDFSNDTIEKLLLKRALADKHWLSIVSNIYDELFSRSKFKDRKTLFGSGEVSLVFNLAMKFYAKHNTCPNVKIIQLLAQKYQEVHPEDTNANIAKVNELLVEVQNMNFGIDESILSNNFKQYIKKQALYETLSENADILTQSGGDWERVVDQCLSNFDKVQKITFNDTDLGMRYFDPQAMKDHWDFLKNPKAKVSTGWNSLDTFTNGGFLKDGRMLGLIMAQAGLGKSAFLSNMVVNFLKQNLSVVVISLEMSEDVYAQRFDAHISKKNINKLAENELIAVQRIKEFYEQYPSSNLFIKEYPPRSIRTRDIEQYLENLKNAGNQIDVIVVDYLNLVLPNKSADSMYKDGLTVSEELRSLSYKFNAPVISATQCNSEGMNSETIDMQNVSESRGIVHTADFLAALMQNQDDRENGFVRMRILKNRLGGQIGKICTFQMDPETLVVADRTFDSNFEVSEGEQSELGNLLKNLPDISSDISKL